MDEFKNIVKFTLGAMVDLAQTDSSYSFFADAEYYYNNTVRPKLTAKEFEDLIMEVFIEKNVPKHSLR